MGPIFYVMAILGCGEGDTACQQVTIADTHYQSAEACDKASAAVIESHSDAPYPVIVAQCRPAATAASQTLFPDDVQLPARGKPRLDRAAAAARHGTPLGRALRS
jgi:hypothetical protein